MSFQVLEFSKGYYTKRKLTGRQINSLGRCFFISTTYRDFGIVPLDMSQLEKIIKHVTHDQTYHFNVAELDCSQSFLVYQKNKKNKFRDLQHPEKFFRAVQLSLQAVHVLQEVVTPKIIQMVTIPARRQTCLYPKCPTLGAATKLKLCSRCKTIYYCSQACQRNDYAHHKPMCQETSYPVEKKHARPLTKMFTFIPLFLSQKTRVRLCHLSHAVHNILD